MELGAFEGGLTCQLAHKADSVVAVEGREENLKRARFLWEFAGLKNVTGVLADLETFPLETLGSFDAAFVVGLLYHLPRPWELLTQLRHVTGRLFLWTHVAVTGKVREHGYAGWWYDEHGRADVYSGLSARSFWPTEPELVRMLREAGFGNAVVLDRGESNSFPWVTLTAEAP